MMVSKSLFKEFNTTTIVIQFPISHFGAIDICSYLIRNYIPAKILMINLSKLLDL